MLCNKAAVGVLTARTLKSAFIADGDLIFASDADEQICCLPELNTAGSRAGRSGVACFCILNLLNSKNLLSSEHPSHHP